MAESAKKILLENPLYSENKNQWNYLYESYVGGEVYKKGKYLTKYTEEAESDYEARIKSTHLDNHCSSVISVYTSFLFREPPTREFGSLDGQPDTAAFIDDADLEGRSLNNFMKDVSQWASVFGHCWVMTVKPNTNAQTRADELDQEVRPYVSVITPLAVLDWNWARLQNGVYHLDYFKYIEDRSGSLVTIKEWSTDIIRTTLVETVNNTIVETYEDEINQLDSIPATIVYNKRSMERGIGVSDISDIADAQRSIYNNNSETEQSIRLDTHPSLVKTDDTDEGCGAGAIITIDPNADPALKPYLLEYSGASVQSILSSSESIVSAIDKMANTGAVRATESKTMSGIAMITEFQLLNARLSEKAAGLALAEEQIWRIFAKYQNKAWDGNVTYPGSFNIQDTANEFEQLGKAKNASTDNGVHKLIDSRIVELLGEDPDDILEGTDSEVSGTE